MPAVNVCVYDFPKTKRLTDASYYKNKQAKINLCFKSLSNKISQKMHNIDISHSMVNLI